MFEREVGYLRQLENVKYSNPDEWESIQNICSSLEKGDVESFNQNYYSYHSIKRHSRFYHQEGFEIAEKIFYELNPRFKQH
jgi:hypothetical protein